MSTASIIALLGGGGDDRLAIDPTTGLNIYGHGPVPRPDDIAMGSSTASTISAAAFEALQEDHARLMGLIDRDGAGATYRVEMERVRSRIRAAIGHDRPGGDMDIVLAPSGTDLHLLASALFAQADRPPLLTITLEGSETGSSIRVAAGGAHFMRQLPSGATVTPGVAVHDRSTSLSLPVRDGAGALRSEESIEDELDAHISGAIRQGTHCLLVVADVSKTGLIAPSLTSVFRLKRRYGRRLEVMIDACQLRTSPETIAAYLAHGFPIAITGSKFLGGPVFSGALLVPPALSRRFREASLATGVADYCGASDWPASWKARQDMPDRPNLGLLLRWSAALFEWEALLAVPPASIAHVTSTFARAVEQRICKDPAMAPIASRPIDRRALDPDVNTFGDTTPTIFPFLLVRQDADGHPAGYLTRDETRSIFQRLASGAASERSVRVGQPVACGRRTGMDVSALRLCLSARLILEASESPAALDRLVATAMSALDAIAVMARAIVSTANSVAA
jgi:hypothetical protein